MFDYVIVGAGSAGCALAARLTEDPEVSVALVEAGPTDAADEIHIPAAFPSLFKSPLDGTPQAEGGLGLARTNVLTANIVAGVFLCLAVIASAILSDRFGRRAVLLTGTLLGLVVGPIAFAVMQPGSTLSYCLAMGVLMLAIGIPYGPAGAYLPELFEARYRYTGAGMAYNLAGVLGGAIPLIVAEPLLDRFGTHGLAGFVSFLALVSTACLLAMRETHGTAIDGDPEPAVVPATV